MRKILLATSAIVAGSAFATAASAAEAPKLDISGKIDIQYIGESYDNSDVSANAYEGTQKIDHLPFMTELTFDANAEADNGLKYGGRIELRPSSSATKSDEIWIDVAGAFGKVILGQDDGVGDANVPAGGSVLVGSFGFTGTYAAGTNGLPGDAEIDEGSFANTGDDNKISYYTPNFGGFTAGVSYTFDSNSLNSAASGEKSENFGDHLELLAKWSGDVAGSSVTVAGSYKKADSNVATREDLKAWEIGAKASFGDLSVGANYYDNSDSGVTKTSTTDDAGNGYSLGVAYSFGDVAVSAGYLSTEVERGGKDDTYENLSLDVQYTVAEGLTTYAGIQFAEGEDGSDTSTAGSNEATAVVIGTRLSF